MGTSSARRGPTTGLWRRAKGTATRYLSPAAGGEVSAREVVARYLAALGESPGQGDRLAAFRFTRKVAQDLGAFWQEVDSRSFDAVLAAHGLAPLREGPPEMLASGLSAVVAGSGGGLEEAVVQTAVALVVRPAVAAPDRPDPAQVVRRFLAMAVGLRLALDLGESLEAAASSYGHLRDGLDRLQAVLEAGTAAAEAPAAPPATPGHWRGLPGWTWVTEIMTGLLKNLGG
jgi:pyruvate/2-oxoglutarate dehydrogenase complex dihydrolipoamide acyltransferase (E2) component